jgi:hypothetical protein
MHVNFGSHFKILYFPSSVYKFAEEIKEKYYWENYLKKSFVVYNLYQILLVWTNEGKIEEKYVQNNLVV